MLRTIEVTSGNAEQLWATRKSWFFKPSGGFGSKAVYRGDKVTKGVWAEIVRGGYVAQEFAPASERTIKLDGVARRFAKPTYGSMLDGQVLLTAPPVPRADNEFPHSWRWLRSGFCPHRPGATRAASVRLLLLWHFHAGHVHHPAALAAAHHRHVAAAAAHAARSMLRVSMLVGLRVVDRGLPMPHVIALCPGVEA